MTCHVELLEATLNHIDEAIVVLDEQSNVLFWNKAATDFTGYSSQDVIAQPLPDLYRVDPVSPDASAPAADAPLRSLTLVTLTHKLGHALPGMLRRLPLHSVLDQPSGQALFFYPIEAMDTPARSRSNHPIDVERTQANTQDRLEAAHHQWLTHRLPLALLWISIDQAEALRISHGSDACEAMLRTVERTLARQMQPAEIIGRWGEYEFLVIAHERSNDNLLEHAQRLVGIARTADFRWWGDRVELTASIGISVAAEGLTLQALLSNARTAMHSATYAGGNQVTESRGI